jgi:hypothetical protein
MRVPFSELPGRRERHYRRRLGNPLFGGAALEANEDDLLEVQRLDHEELLVFLEELRELVRRAVDLKPNEDSQVVLDLKSDLDRLYETASGLADDQSGNKLAIRQLLAVIMKTVWQSAGNDSLAEAELAQEEQARAAHFDLLEQPLLADLLHPESVISAEELLPTLLSESEPALRAALELFEVEQLATLHADARALLAGLGEAAPAGARQRLQLIERHLAERRPGSALN